MVVQGIPDHDLLPQNYNLTKQPTIPVMAAYLRFLLHALQQGYLPRGHGREMVMYFKDSNQRTGAVHALSAGILDRYKTTDQVRSMLASFERTYGVMLNKLRAGSNTNTASKTIHQASEEMDSIFLAMQKPHTPLLRSLAGQIQPQAAAQAAAQNAPITRGSLGAARRKVANNQRSVAFNADNVAPNLNDTDDLIQTAMLGQGQPGNRPANARANARLGNTERQGIVHRIGNILYQHRNNTNGNNVINDTDIPRWMRNVYGVRRARKILANRDRRNTTTKKKGLTFRRMTFANLPSFIPRHH
jgi:hypothetical protein